MAETFDMSYQATNITRVRGDTWPFRFEIKNSDGTAKDISSHTFSLSVDVSEEPTDETGQLFKLTGSIVAPASGGIVEFALSAVQSDQTPATYYFDVEMTDGSGTIRTVAKGEWNVVQDVTKT